MRRQAFFKSIQIQQHFTQFKFYVGWFFSNKIVSPNTGQIRGKGARKKIAPKCNIFWGYVSQRVVQTDENKHR